MMSVWLSYKMKRIQKISFILRNVNYQEVLTEYFSGSFKSDVVPAKIPDLPLYVHSGASSLEHGTYVCFWDRQPFTDTPSVIPMAIIETTDKLLVQGECVFCSDRCALAQIESYINQK